MPKTNQIPPVPSTSAPATSAPPAPPPPDVIHYIGLDVHKNSVAISIAPAGSTEVRHYGSIGGTLADFDRVLKKLVVPETTALSRRWPPGLEKVKPWKNEK